MAHDVFVSYSAKDKAAADAVVAGLEADGFRCWIAPRDILAGTAWGDAIVEAIAASRIMVIVLSGHSNRSPQVRREVERAVNDEVAILPLRIEEIDPSGAMAYYLATEHWLDALTPPLQSHIGRLVDSVRALITGESLPESAQVAPVPVPAPRRNRGLLIGGAAAVGVLAIGGALFAMSGGDGEADAASAASSTTVTTSPPTTAAEASTTTGVATTLPGIEEPPPMFAIPTDGEESVFEAAGRWHVDHEPPATTPVAEEVALLAAESEKWAPLIDTSQGGALGDAAPAALCQLMEEGTAPDDIAAQIAVAAGEVAGDEGADYTFVEWVGTVATSILCPEYAAPWRVANGALGGDLLLAEDFENAAIGWETGSWDTGTVEIRDGTMVFAPSPINTLMQSSNGDDFTDVVIDVWVQSSGSSMDAGSGVICRESYTSPYSSFYLFEVNHRGEFHINYFRSTGHSTHIAGRYFDAIKPPPETNHLTAYCGEDDLTLLINGKMAASLSHSELSQGTVSLFAFAGENSGEVQMRFDNLIIRSPSPEAAELIKALRVAPRN